MAKRRSALCHGSCCLLGCLLLISGPDYDRDCCALALRSLACDEATQHSLCEACKVRALSVGVCLSLATTYCCGQKMMTLTLCGCGLGLRLGLRLGHLYDSVPFAFQPVGYRWRKPVDRDVVDSDESPCSELL